MVEIAFCSDGLSKELFGSERLSKISMTLLTSRQLGLAGLLWF